MTADASYPAAYPAVKLKNSGAKNYFAGITDDTTISFTTA